MKNPLCYSQACEIFKEEASTKKTNNRVCLREYTELFFTRFSKDDAFVKIQGDKLVISIPEDCDIKLKIISFIQSNGFKNIGPLSCINFRLSDCNQVHFTIKDNKNIEDVNDLIGSFSVFSKRDIQTMFDKKTIEQLSVDENGKPWNPTYFPKYLKGILLMADILGPDLLIDYIDPKELNDIKEKLFKLYDIT